jgi:hypothetical protein
MSEEPLSPAKFFKWLSPALLGFAPGYYGCWNFLSDSCKRSTGRGRLACTLVAAMSRGRMTMKMGVRRRLPLGQTKLC